MLRDEFLDVCGKLMVVCDELGVSWLHSYVISAQM
jgi:hypothetical protein